MYEKQEGCPECHRGYAGDGFNYDFQFCVCGWSDRGGPRKTMQTLFGGPDSPPGLRGNCYPACISSIMGIALKDVPHFYSLWPEIDGSSEEAHRQLSKWMNEKGWCYAQFPWPLHYLYLPMLMDSLVIVSGKSPRMEGLHAVVGKIVEGGWELWHDPHPDKTGVVGEPEFIEVFFRPVKEN